MSNPNMVTVCPFYQRESGKSITCEGMGEKTEIAIKFNDNFGKQIWQKKYCRTYKYGGCPIAEIVEKLYK